MKRMISACLRFEAPDLWLAVPAALFPVLVVEVTALMIAATEDDPEALVLLPSVGMILTVVLCCVLGVVYLCSNFPLLLQFSASRRGSLAGLCLHILRMTVLAEVIAAAATMALGAVNHGFFPRFAVGELWRGIPVFVWPVCAVLPVLVGVLFTLLHAFIQSYVLTMLTAMFYGEVSEPSPPRKKKTKKPPEPAQMLQK